MNRHRPALAAALLAALLALPALGAAGSASATGSAPSPSASDPGPTSGAAAPGEDALPPSAAPGAAHGARGTSTAAGRAQVARSTSGRYVVRLARGDAATRRALPDRLRAAVAALGGRVVAAQAALGTVVVDVPGGPPSGLLEVPGVLAVSPDRSVRALSLGFDPSGQAGSMTNITRITGAQAMWKAGWTGSGVDVALIDSGVSPVSALKDSAKIVIGPDLSFESQDVDLRHLDSYGHGTHMAGVIAGRETSKASGSTYAADRSNYYGMAPDARIVSLKLADHDGAVDVSQIIAAINWVVQHRSNSGAGLKIKVINLSFGAFSPQHWQIDPLSWAAEVAWHNGIVVVAAAGNTGETAPGIANPAYNPWVLAVGAADTRGTDTTSDDVVPAFSARQGGNWGGRGIDVIAPGVGVVGPGVPGSNLSAAYPGARLGNGFLRGSGTSQAAAVVSGAVALLLQQRPTLTPDNVKELLKSTAAAIPGQPATAQGSGELNLARAMSVQPSGRSQGLSRGNGQGSLQSSRGGVYISVDGVPLQGELDIMGNQWQPQVMASAAASRTAWSSDGSFNGAGWVGGGFASDTSTWAGKTWSGKTWSGKTWSGKTWSGKTWTGRTWSSAVWTGSTWSSTAWPSPVGSTAMTAKQWSARTWR